MESISFQKVLISTKYPINLYYKYCMLEFFSNFASDLLRGGLKSNDKRCSPYGKTRLY